MGTNGQNLPPSPRRPPIPHGEMGEPQYMLLAASTWLPVTLLKFTAVLVLALVAAVAALDVAGDWAADSSARVALTGCPSEREAFSVRACSGIDFVGGAPASYAFSPVETYSRWLRVNLTVFAEPRRGLLPNTTVTLRVRISARDEPTQPWEEQMSAPSIKPVDCPPRVLIGAEPCSIFNAAFYQGLSRRHYLVQIALVPSAVSNGIAPSEWMRGVVLEASSGQPELGRADLAVRTLGAAIALLALLRYARDMRPFALRLWLPQQRATLGYLLVLLLYNDPTRALVTVDGARDYLAPTVWAVLHVAGSAVLALALLDMRAVRRTVRRAHSVRGYAPQAASQLHDSPCVSHRAAPAAARATQPAELGLAAPGAPSPLPFAIAHAPERTPADESRARYADGLGARTVSARGFWLPKLALGVAIFATSLSLNGLLYARMRVDPGATYRSVGGWEGWFAAEGALALVWVCFALQLVLNGVRFAAEEDEQLKREAEAGELRLCLDGGHAVGSTGYLATAGLFALALAGIILREVLRTRVADHPHYSDTAFRTQLQNVVVANLLGVGLALCFAPAHATCRIREAGGLHAALEHGRAGLGGLTRALAKHSHEVAAQVGQPRTTGAKPAATRGEVASEGAALRAGPPDAAGARAPAADASDGDAAGADGSAQRPFGAPPLAAMARAKAEQLARAADAPPPHGVAQLARLLGVYARKMRDAFDASDAPVSESTLAELRELRDALEKLPETARHAQHIKWRYPVLYKSRAPFLWALLVRDVDSEEGRAFWVTKHAALDAALGEPAPARTIAELYGAGVHGDGALAAAAADVLADAATGTRAPPSVRRLLGHLRALGLTFTVRQVHTRHGPHALVLIEHSEAVSDEHQREHALRVNAESELTVGATGPISTADKLRALARLLTEHPMHGQSHARLPAGGLSVRAQAVPFELVSASFPLHDRELNSSLHAELRGVYVLSDEQLTVLRDHYGDELAFYYALLNFSCVAIAPIGSAGLLLFLLRYSDAERIYAQCYVAFASLTVLWGAAVFVLWRRRALQLAILWDVSSLREAAELNPRFRGSALHDDVRGVVPHVPYSSRLAAFCTTFAIFVLQAALLVLLEYVVYAHWVWLNEAFDDDTFAYYAHSYVLNSLLYIVLIMYGHYMLWGAVARWTTGLENWESTRLFERNYVAYVFLFIWLDGYMWSFIIGFVHIPLIEAYTGDLTQVEFPLFGKLFRSNDKDADYWMAKHDSTIIAMLSNNQLAGLLAENALPVLLVAALHARLRASQRARAAQPARPGARAADAAQPLLPIEQQALEESTLWPYSTQDDYYDVILFIGYVATYTVIWPLTPLTCWVNNHIELRTDLIKINRAWRRVVPARVDGIGSWQPALGASIAASVLLVVAFACISTRRAEVFFAFAQNEAHPQHELFWSVQTGNVYLTARCVVLVIWEHALGVLVALIFFFVPAGSARLLALKLAKARRHATELQVRAERLGASSARLLETEPSDGAAGLGGGDEVPTEPAYTTATRRPLEKRIEGVC